MRIIILPLLLCVLTITISAEMLNVQMFSNKKTILENEITQQPQYGFEIDGFGNISAAEISSILFTAADELYRQTGLKGKYKQRVFGRANEILNLAKAQQIKVLPGGTFLYRNVANEKINKKIDGAAFNMIFNAIKKEMSQPRFRINNYKELDDEQVKRYYDIKYPIKQENER